MARYQMFTVMPLATAPTLADTFEAVSHLAAIDTVAANLRGVPGPDADVELRHLETPDGGVPIARWIRRAPEPEFKRA
jgi:hypothetical protein